MKKLFLLTIMLLMATIFLQAAVYNTVHFVPAYHITPYPNGQNPYHAHNALVYLARVNGVDLGVGSEIGAFDGATCVGGSQITGPFIFPSNVPMVISTEGGYVPDSATNGHFMYFRVWDHETNTEYAYPEMFVQFALAPTWPDADCTMYYVGGGTTHVFLDYVTPVAKNSQTIPPPPGPFGGYVEDIEFPGTGVILEEAAVIAGGGGTMTVYYYDVNSLDTYYGGTPGAGTMPVENFSNFHWFIDANGIKFSAAESYPVAITFTIPSLPPGTLIDPNEIGVYRRDIHGTSWFFEVNSSYDPIAGTITVYITDPDDVTGEYILAGFFEDGLPVELSSFTAAMSNTNNAVNLTWVTQSESNLVGYRIYRGLDNILAQAENQNTLIPATNTSQQVVYSYKDEDVQPEQLYYYWLESAEMDGSSTFHGPVSISTPGEAIYTPEIPLVTGISSLYPNPFNPNLTIGYQLENKQNVNIVIVNSRGQIVKRLVDGEKDKGFYKYIWDGKDEGGRDCASGVYTIWMKTGLNDYFRKAVLLK